MIINSINNANVFSFKNSVQNNSAYRQTNSLGTDTVSFSGTKVQPEELSPIAQEGISAGKKLIKLQRADRLNYDTISELLNSRSPVPINIKHVSEAPNFIKAQANPFAAYMLPFYRPDYSLAGADIYLKTSATAKEAGDLIANTAHEFSHVLQRAADTSYFGLTEYTKDTKEITALAKISQQVSSSLERIYAHLLTSNPEFQKGVRAGKQFSAKDYEKILNPDGNLAETSKGAIKSVLSQLTDGTSEGKTLRQNPIFNDDTILKAVTQWIRRSSAMEVEAYDVTLGVLKQWGKYDLSVFNSRQMSQVINKIMSSII